MPVAPTYFCSSLHFCNEMDKISKMNWRKHLVIWGLLIGAFRLPAQLPNGSIAPNFTAQDITGQTHVLYDLLNAGKIVVLEISATWCPPCWVYHNSNALQELYNTHGPSGDDKLRVLWVEGDPNTNLNCLYGPAGCVGGTAGNYVAGTSYPIIDNAAIASAYQISYYPTIYIICPNKKTYEVQPLPAEELWEKAQHCPVAHGTNNAGIYQYSTGMDLSEICGTQEITPTFALTNLGSAALTEATVELRWNNDLVQTLQWSGYLGTYAEAPIFFESLSISDNGLLKTTITNINNGTGDDDTSNNVRNDAFTRAAQFSTTQVLLKLRTDNYPEETYWELRNEYGTVLDFGGNTLVGANGGGAFPLGPPIGPGTYPKLTIIRDTLNLPSNGCYSIHFSDGYGDGMCCGFGAGYYRLYNLDNPGVAIISGGEFGAYSRRGFGAGSLSSTEQPLQLADIQVYPNPASDVLHIAVDAPVGKDISGNVFNTLGQLQHRLPLEKAETGGNDFLLPLADWPTGLYYLHLKIGETSVTRAFVVNH